MIVTLLILTLSGCASVKQIDKKESIKLFTALDKCTTSGKTHWSITQGTVIGTGEPGYVGTKEVFEDFILTAEFLPGQEINSGIFIRCPSHEGSAKDCYEINIWDDHVNQEFRTGSIVTHGPPLAIMNSVGKWNKYVIKAMGDHIEVWLNDVKTADLTNNKSSKGYILLQRNGQGEIKFRNVNITRL